MTQNTLQNKKGRPNKYNRNIFQYIPLNSQCFTLYIHALLQSLLRTLLSGDMYIDFSFFFKFDLTITKLSF